MPLVDPAAEPSFDFEVFAVDVAVPLAFGLGFLIRKVLVETSDGNTEWTTVGVDENVVAASWRALEDAVSYGLMRQNAIPDEG